MSMLPDDVFRHVLKFCDVEDLVSATAFGKGLQTDSSLLLYDRFEHYVSRIENPIYYPVFAFMKKNEEDYLNRLQERRGMVMHDCNRKSFSLKFIKRHFLTSRWVNIRAQQMIDELLKIKVSVADFDHADCTGRTRCLLQRCAVAMDSALHFLDTCIGEMALQAMLWFEDAKHLSLSYTIRLLFNFAANLNSPYHEHLHFKYVPSILVLACQYYVQARENYHEIQAVTSSAVSKGTNTLQ